MANRADQIRKAIEAKGYTVLGPLVYERPGMHLEKGGQEGGWYVNFDGGSIDRWNYKEVLEEIADLPPASEYFIDDAASPQGGGESGS